MAGDVGYLVHALNSNRGYHKSHRLHPTLITRDLLGESFSDISSDSQRLDLELEVPAGWEKRLDLKSGKMYLQKCSSSKQDRPATRPIIKRTFDNNLDLKLVVSPLKPTYESVCTLDKVKSALDREMQEQLTRRKLFIPTSSKSPSSSSGASISDIVTLKLETDEEDEKNTTSMSSSSQQEGCLKLSAAGCSNCLMYVMISDDNPKCPKCNSTVSLPVVKKKPRISLDLNLYLSDELCP